MTRALMITPDIRHKIKALKEKAAAHPIPIKKVMDKALAPEKEFEVKLSDRDPGKTYDAAEGFLIPVGYRVAYSVEEQPAGICAHLSISVDKKGKLPHPEAIKMIAFEFGCEDLKDSTGWIEEFEPGHDAVNVVWLLSKASTPDTPQ